MATTVDDGAWRSDSVIGEATELIFLLPPTPPIGLTIMIMGAPIFPPSWPPNKVMSLHHPPLILLDLEFGEKIMSSVPCFFLSICVKPM